jgi:tryptophanyl-tRNA synthetase
VRRSDPGEPDDCVAWSLNHQYLPAEKQAEICTACRAAAIGCVDCKKIQAQALVEALAPFRSRREELTASPSMVNEILAEGSRKAAAAASVTMSAVREALKV